MIKRIKIDLPVEPLLQLIEAVAVLCQQPHDLGHDGLNGHIVGLEEAEAVLDPLAHLVDAHVAALVSDLGGEDEHFVGLVVVAVGQGEGTYRTRRSPCTSASAGKFTEAKAS